MTTKFTNAPAPDELLLTARESLKSVLREPDADHAYTILMAMNAMGIAARAMQCEAVPPACRGTSDDDFKRRMREADEAAVSDPQLVAGLRRHIEGKLALSNPRFGPEKPREST